MMNRKMQNQHPTAEIWVEKLAERDILWLYRAITLVESTRSDHRELAAEIIEKCVPIVAQKQSFRLGISGAPGVGKSTFIEHFGCFLLENEQKMLAVLTIDPSSSISRGSILGDKTRMEKLATHPRAFIRPSPAGNALGGVARRTRETITLLETAGFDTIFIETVGVGQSETAVKSMTDCFLLLLLPGAGDDLQGIKRGIVEMADLVAVNKTDGDRVALAREASIFYQNALHLFPKMDSNWTPKVLNCSATEQNGFEEIQKNLEDFEKMTRENGFFEKNRQQQAKFWLRESIENGLRDTFFSHPNVQKQFVELEKMVGEGQISPFRAAERLLDIYFEK
jgi:LAO/AO transport system kinase